MQHFQNRCLLFIISDRWDVSLGPMQAERPPDIRLLVRDRADGELLGFSSLLIPTRFVNGLFDEVHRRKT